MIPKHEKSRCIICNKMFKRGTEDTNRNKNLSIGIRPSTSNTCSQKCSTILRDSRDYDLCSCGNQKGRQSKTCWDCYSSQNLNNTSLEVENG